MGEAGLNEAVVPLPDGRSIPVELAHPPVNLIRSEAGNNAELRAALAELQAEVRALRESTESAGAATVGQLKEHNRRERKRDVVPQKVEISE
jgi:hypothetical protein